MIQKVALDSCVVIDLIEKPKVAHGFKTRLRGKQIKIVLCDVVLDEVRRVRGFSSQSIVSSISRLLQRDIEILQVQKEQRHDAEAISSQYSICHNGDNKILSLCRAKSLVLVTFDRMLLKSCQFLGVAGFHPSTAGGI